MASVGPRDLTLLVALAAALAGPPVATVVSLIARRPMPAWFGGALALAVGAAAEGATFHADPTWLPDLRRAQSWFAPGAAAWTLAAIAAGRVLVALRLAGPDAEPTPRRAALVALGSVVLSIPVAVGTSGVGCVAMPILAALVLGGLRSDPGAHRDPAAAELVAALAVCVPPSLAWWAFGTPTPGWPALPLLAGLVLGSRLPDARPALVLGLASALGTLPYFRGWTEAVAWELSGHALPRSSEPAEAFDPTPTLGSQAIALVDAAAPAGPHEAVLVRTGSGALAVARRVPGADEAAIWVSRAGPDTLSVEGGPPISLADPRPALQGSLSGCNPAFVRIADPERWTEQEVRDLCGRVQGSGCGVGEVPPERRCRPFR